MNALVPIAGKVAKLIRLLASDRDGEVLSAVAALRRALESAGSDLHELAKAVTNGGGELSEAEMRKLFNAGFAAGLEAAREDREEGFHDADDWHSKHDYCERNKRHLRTRDRDFIESLGRWQGKLTPKMQNWLDDVYARLRRRPQ
jgi:hypothetical protein